MSVYTTARVWKHSQQKGSAFLVLLSMADISDEHGVLFAGAGYLSKQSRLDDPRYTRRLITRLAEGGEILINRARRADGMHLPNYYIVTVGASEETIAAAKMRVAEMQELRGAVDWGTGLQTRTGLQTHTGLQNTGVRVHRPSPDRVYRPSDPSYPLREDGSDDQSVLKFWRAVLDELQHVMAKGTFTTHLEKSRAALLADDELVIKLAADFNREWVASRLDEVIVRTVSGIAGRPLKVTYQV